MPCPTLRSVDPLSARSEIYANFTNLLAQLAHVVGGDALHIFVCVDGFIVLAGSVLTACVLVGAGGPGAWGPGGFPPPPRVFPVAATSASSGSRAASPSTACSRESS